MSEGTLKKQIMSYLNTLPDAYFRVIQVRGIKGRRSLTTGVPDIIGTYFGRAVAIEVKLPGNKLSIEQNEFFQGWIKRGNGTAMVATDLGTVISALDLIRKDVKGI